MTIWQSALLPSQLWKSFWIYDCISLWISICWDVKLVWLSCLCCRVPIFGFISLFVLFSCLILSFIISISCDCCLFFSRINTILPDNLRSLSLRSLISFCTLLESSGGINGGKDDGSDWLEDWNDVCGAWWDSLSVEDELWKKCWELR